MPLYETVIIARASNAKGSVNLMKQISQSILAEGGNVRNIEVLGDRVLVRQIRGQDLKKHLVGRYLQILYDGSPECKTQVEKTSKASYESLQVKSFRLKDFYNDAQMYRKTSKAPSVVDPTQFKEQQYIETLKQIQQENQLKNNVKKSQKAQQV
ncbi:Ribosomal protein S6 [Pseudocohnilembus persalinus]|uniref:Ribosomal protein S6 n=1 Tax=Pseudocohnilembus persalinus TaxID=266149 RepID=A0A0V0QB36_PSEPJ|nr:Ribosomal protein S6 [Pseudocohnilembus persalinus]|eukprot:KRW99438.1 Ribosomal protein S6 [Pseudocohnilembus persalinus]